MRLVKDHSVGAHSVEVWCLACHARKPLADMVSDLDGHAFVAYYCAGQCAPVVSGKCNRDGCTKPECQTE